MTPKENVFRKSGSSGSYIRKVQNKLGVKKNTLKCFRTWCKWFNRSDGKSICKKNSTFLTIISCRRGMFDSLPQTVLDELCQQYDLDDLDRQIIDLYVSFQRSCAAKSETHPEKFGKE